LLFRISSPYFVAGAVTKQSRVVKAAPIIKYMIGWHSLKVVQYCKKKGWEWELL